MIPLAHADLLTAIEQAISAAPERKFLESIELAVNLKDVDMQLPKNRIEEEILLPNGRGREVKVAVFAVGELGEKAKGVADLVISAEELEAIADEKSKAKALARDITYFLAAAPLMGAIGKRWGIILGPRGKMPRPLPPNADPKPIIENLRRSVKIRTKDRLSFHAPIGTRTMPVEEIAQNAEAVMKRVHSKLERGEMNIRSIYVKTSMGPSVKVEGV